MQTALCVEVDLVGIAILLVMLVNRKNSVGLTTSQLWFNRMLFLVLLTLSLDAISWMLEGHLFPGAIALNTGITTAYYALNIISCFCWAIYVKSVLYPEHVALDAWAKMTSIWGIPALMYIITNIWTGQVFYFDAENRYHRGPYFWLILVVLCLVLLCASWMAIRSAKRAKLPSQKQECITLACFPLPSAMGIIVQVLFYGISLIWVCTAVALLIVFIYHQNRQIAIDQLTGLNNRTQFGRHLAMQMHGTSPLPFALIMIDIDHFKHINDTFGHVEGDNALVAAANVLKFACRRENVFLSRYGGDEFTIIFPNAAEFQVKALIAEIRAEMARIGQDEKAEYHLSFSIGYTFYEPEDTEKSIMERADSAMYKEKQLLGKRTSSPI